MNTVIVAAILYLTFYFSHNLIDILLEWLRCKVDKSISKDRLEVMKLQDEMQPKEDEVYTSTEAIGFHYTPSDDEDEYEDDDDDDDGTEEET